MTYDAAEPNKPDDDRYFFALLVVIWLGVIVVQLLFG